jgi:hypothetical protein
MWAQRNSCCAFCYCLWATQKSHLNTLKTAEEVALCPVIHTEWPAQIIAQKNACRRAQLRATIWPHAIKTWILRRSNLTQQLNSMEQGPSWESDSFSASQNISHILLNPKVRRRVRNSPPLAPILSQVNPIHAIPSCLLKIRSNSLPSKSRSSKWPLFFGHPHQNPVPIKSF